jgi:hypothetical protein
MSFEVLINPPEDPLADPKLFVPWKSTTMQYAIRSMFNIGAREGLVRIDVGPDGIQGYLAPIAPRPSPLSPHP